MSETFSTLCDLDGPEIKKNLDEIAAIVRKPKFICTNCARVAKKKKFLCRGTKLPKPPA